MRFHQHSPYADWGFVDATIQAREELGDQTDDTRFTEYFAEAVREMAVEQGVTFELTPRDVRHALRLGRIFPPGRRIPRLSFRHHEAAADSAEPFEWLERAASGDWKPAQLRRAIREQHTANV
jgi:hypothetical protein